MRLYSTVIVLLVLASLTADGQQQTRIKRLLPYDMGTSYDFGASADALGGSSSSANNGNSGGSGMSSMNGGSSYYDGGHQGRSQSYSSSCSTSSGDNEHRAQNMPNLKMQTGTSKQRASGIALKAAQEAKQANDDMASAVKTASEKIKIEYAEKAAAAAKAAEAVLAGKSQVLEQLEMEVREAEQVVHEESQALCTAEANAQMAQKASSQAKEELNILLAGLQLARDNFGSSEQVSNTCQQSLNDKTILLEAAQNRVNVLLRQLDDARADFGKTKKAAYKAACAAHEAKERIDRSRRQAAPGAVG